MNHQHTIECYASNASGPLAYTPCRSDGLDQNLRNLNRADFEAGYGLKGLTLICNVRKDWDSYFMDIAQMVSTRATCPRGQVGAVFVRDRNILATGYNGSVPGAPHCGDLPDEVHVVNGHCDIVLHAEENAIIQAAKNGIIIAGSTVYCTHRPCWPCTKRLLSVGVKRIVYGQDYRPDEKTSALCALLEVPLIQM